MALGRRANLKDRIGAVAKFFFDGQLDRSYYIWFGVKLAVCGIWAIACSLIVSAASGVSDATLAYLYVVSAVICSAFLVMSFFMAIYHNQLCPLVFDVFVFMPFAGLLVIGAVNAVFPEDPSYVSNAHFLVSASWILFACAIVVSLAELFVFCEDEILYPEPAERRSEQNAQPKMGWRSATNAGTNPEGEGCSSSHDERRSCTADNPKHEKEFHLDWFFPSKTASLVWIGIGGALTIAMAVVDSFVRSGNESTMMLILLFITTFVVIAYGSFGLDGELPSTLRACEGTCDTAGKKTLSEGLKEIPFRVKFLVFELVAIVVATAWAANELACGAESYWSNAVLMTCFACFMLRWVIEMNRGLGVPVMPLLSVLFTGSLLLAAFCLLNILLPVGNADTGGFGGAVISGCIGAILFIVSTMLEDCVTNFFEAREAAREKEAEFFARSSRDKSVIADELVAEAEETESSEAASDDDSSVKTNDEDEQVDTENTGERKLGESNFFVWWTVLTVVACIGDAAFFGPSDARGVVLFLIIATLWFIAFALEANGGANSLKARDEEKQETQEGKKAGKPSEEGKCSLKLCKIKAENSKDTSDEQKQDGTESTPKDTGEGKLDKLERTFLVSSIITIAACTGAGALFGLSDIREVLLLFVFAIAWGTAAFIAFKKYENQEKPEGNSDSSEQEDASENNSAETSDEGKQDSTEDAKPVHPKDIPLLIELLIILGGLLAPAVFAVIVMILPGFVLATVAISGEGGDLSGFFGDGSFALSIMIFCQIAFIGALLLDRRFWPDDMGNNEEDKQEAENGSPADNVSGESSRAEELCENASDIDIRLAALAAKDGDSKHIFERAAEQVQSAVCRYKNLSSMSCVDGEVLGTVVAVSYRVVENAQVIADAATEDVDGSISVCADAGIEALLDANDELIEQLDEIERALVRNEVGVALEASEKAKAMAVAVKEKLQSSGF